MRSRSCYATAASSGRLWVPLLFCVACLGQDGKQDDGRAAARDRTHAADVGTDEHKADEKRDEKKADEKIPPEHGPDAADGGEETGDADTGSAEETGGPELADDGCELGEMVFEGRCTSKERVSKLLDGRKAEALERVQLASKPKQAVDSAYDLIEQQTYQMDKVEDDLDEIIEQLKREQEQAKHVPDDPDKKGGTL